MATDTAVRQAIEKVDALCPRLFVPGSDPVSEVHLERCRWPGHRLVREVAKVARLEQAKESLTIYDSLSWVGDNPAIVKSLKLEIERIAALSSENTERARRNDGAES